jgi:hypothetical protein
VHGRPRRHMQGGPPMTMPRRALAGVPFLGVVRGARWVAGNGAAASPGAPPARGSATPSAVARGLPTRERATGGTLARPGIRRRRCSGAGEGAAWGRARDGAARGEQGTMAVPALCPASGAGPGLARLRERERGRREMAGG